MGQDKLWIRTELGAIAFKIKEDEYFIYYSNGYILDKGDYKSWWINEREDDYGCYKELPHIQGHGKDFVKKQRDNLIDVLEDGDMYVDSSGTAVTISTLKFMYEVGGFSKTYYTNNFNEYLIGLMDFDKFKIITHEQYMPLAQEVK